MRFIYKRVKVEGHKREGVKMIKKSIFFCMLISLILVAGKGMYAQDRSYEYRVPEKLNDGWEVASLSDVGINIKEIEAITGQIINDERFQNIHSMLIVKNGKLVHEGYFWGHQRNSLHWMASAPGSGGQNLDIRCAA